METKFTFNTIGLFTTDKKKMVDFYRNVEGNLIEIHSLTQN